MKAETNAVVEPAPAASSSAESGDTFAALGLPAPLVEAVTALGFDNPTPIQARAIPPLLEGRDLVGQARTGTGKTAAFGLPLVTRLSRGRPLPTPRALVLTPTRELALQVTDALESFARGSALRLVTVYGGASYGPQLRALHQGVDVVVGTPGRIIDLIERGRLELGDVEMVVLDEADEMLEMGFIDAVETILATTPESTRQVALFSATMPKPIRKVADRYLDNPFNVVETTQHVVAIAQRYVQVPRRFKLEALLRILRSESRDAALVFAATRASCAEAAEFLAANGIPAEPLHGDLSQPARERVVELLRKRRVEVVVATDIAARGIDIDHLTHIINLDLPRKLEVYTHRIGRTGRAGRSGTAITLVTPRETRKFVDALRRRRVAVSELFIASDHELAMGRRHAIADELRALASEPERGPALEDARRWTRQLVESGLALEDIAAGLASRLGGARWGDVLETRRPPWAQSHDPVRPPNGATKPRARDGEHNGSERVVVGVGRAQAARPADLVGALTNELGLSGRDIGRIKLHDQCAVIEVSAAFVSRLGNEVWPLQIRGIETTISRDRRATHHTKRAQRRHPAPRGRRHNHRPAPRHARE